MRAAIDRAARFHAVADGRRALTREQREWCVGEAMVLTGFMHTPVQLLERGEAALARIILDAKPSG